MLLFLLVQCYAVAMIYVALVCLLLFIDFLTLENMHFYIVKLTIQRKSYPTSYFKLRFLPTKIALIVKITYEPFIIHFKVSKNDTNSILLMIPLHTIVGCRFLLHSASSFIQTGLYKVVIAGKSLLHNLTYKKFQDIKSTKE